MKKILSRSSTLFAVCLFVVFSTNFAWALDDLSNAALAGDKEKLEALIANGADVKGDKGGMALYWAAMQGKYETIEVLIAHGANVNSREPNNGFSPLHEAVSYIGNVSSEQDRRKLFEYIIANRVNGRDVERIIRPLMGDAIAKNKKKTAELLIAHGADVNAKSKYGGTPLHKVATKELAELLIAQGANVNAMDINNSTPLYGAISLNKDVVEVLIAHGADVNIKNRSAYTPLHIALNMSDNEIAKLLIAHGADVNAKDQNGSTLVEKALQQRNIELAALLLARGAKVNFDGYAGRTGLDMAINAGSTQMVELMLKYGAQVNDTDRDGKTALFLAVESNQKDIAELLIKHGADMNIVPRGGAPLLHRTRNKEILELLLKHGADANTKDAHGDSLLWQVCYDSQLAELLLKHGADINIKNSEGRTVLHLASRFARDTVVKWMLKHGADVNARADFSGQTPLFHAVRSYERYFANAPANSSYILGIPAGLSDAERKKLIDEATKKATQITSANDLNNVFPPGFDTSNSKATVELLLAHGADVNTTDRMGQSPLHVAPTKDIVKLLLAGGVAVNAKRKDGATALHLAAVYGRKDVVQALLFHGADVNAKTQDGITPLHYAKGVEVVDLLLAKGANVDATDSGGNTPLYMADESSVVDLLLAHGATLNARNNIGQTPLLRVIRTFISNLPAHGLMSGPLGDPIIVAHGGSMETIKALLDHGADVNLDDRDGCMPLFYVREAIKNRAYVEVIDLLKTTEDLLLAHGAKLEKRKKESALQSQQIFPPEIAGIPQISLGTRVMMQVAVQYEERQKAGKENFLFYKEPETITAAPDKLTFDSHLQLLDYFQTLPADVQKNGLWIKRMARQLWTQPDTERLDKLTQNAKSRKTSLFLCEPKAPKNGSWLVVWECDQVSQQGSVHSISCGAVESKGQSARWVCKKREN